MITFAVMTNPTQPKNSTEEQAQGSLLHCSTCVWWSKSENPACDLVSLFFAPHSALNFFCRLLFNALGFKGHSQVGGDDGNKLPAYGRDSKWHNHFEERHLQSYSSSDLWQYRPRRLWRKEYLPLATSAAVIRWFVNKKMISWKLFWYFVISEQMINQLTD